MASSFDRLKELNLSRDEVNRIGEALKNREFRKLLSDYVEEIQDPKNRQIYEEEVKQIELERGQEVTFLHPTPGWVLKTSVDGLEKGFLNICSNDNVGKPTSSPSVKDGAKGLQWALPHSLSPPHEDVDNKGARCQVYDVLFHPDTLHLAGKNAEFRALVNSVALEAVEGNFNVVLDKKNFKLPKMAFKGLKRACIVRKPSGEGPKQLNPNEKQIFDRIYSEIDSQKCKAQLAKTTEKPKEDSSIYTKPKYVIKHCSHIDMQEFTEHKTAKLNTTIPRELIIEINLPLLNSSSDIDLDVTEKTVQLLSERPAKYKLSLTLPYQVNEACGSAKFDKDSKKLIVTLPVKRKLVLETIPNDSGVESCMESDLNSPTSYESDDEPEIEPQTGNVKSQFLDKTDLYNLPEFTCNVFDNTVAFTFNVKNVDEQSVVKRISENCLVQVKFTSISSTFYPTSYAFFVKFPSEHQLVKNEVNIETWDNNVILQLPFKANSEPLKSYFYGLNEANLTEKFMDELAVISANNENPRNEEESKNEAREIGNSKSSKAINIFATSYESSGDELSSSSFSPRKGKGILKRINRSKLGRSVSESSLDDFVCSSFENYHGSIDCVPEDLKEEEEGMSSSFKKTVRFNDVVVKQLFRSNSSILGQKKKNQRKARNKKRAHERRYSESEASDMENKKEGDEQTMESDKGATGKDRKEDSDIFHLEINN